MAVVPKTIIPSLATKLPCDAHRSHNLFPGEDLAAGDACYIATTGLVWRSNGSAVAAAAKVDGFVMMDYKVAGNQPVTLYHNVEVAYGPSTLQPSKRLYVSNTVIGGLDDAPSTGGTAPVAIVQYVTTLQGTASAVIFVMKSTY